MSDKSNPVMNAILNVIKEYGIENVKTVVDYLTNDAHFVKMAKAYRNSFLDPENIKDKDIIQYYRFQTDLDLKTARLFVIKYHKEIFGN